MKTYEVLITETKKIITVDGSKFSMPKHQEDFDDESKEFWSGEKSVGVRELTFGLLIDNGASVEDTRLVVGDLSEYVARRFSSSHGRITSDEILEYRTFKAAGFSASQNADLHARDPWPKAGGVPSLIARATSLAEIPIPS